MAVGVSPGIIRRESCAAGETRKISRRVRQFGCERASRRARRQDIVAGAGDLLICPRALVAGMSQNCGRDAGNELPRATRLGAVCGGVSVGHAW